MERRQAGEAPGDGVGGEHHGAIRADNRSSDPMSDEPLVELRSGVGDDGRRALVQDLFVLLGSDRES